MMMKGKLFLIFSAAALAALIASSGCGKRRRKAVSYYPPPPPAHVPQPTDPIPSYSNCQYTGVQQIVCDRETGAKRFCYASVFCQGNAAFVFCEAVPTVGGSAQFGCPSADVAPPRRIFIRDSLRELTKDAARQEEDGEAPAMMTN